MPRALCGLELFLRHYFEMEKFAIEISEALTLCVPKVLIPLVIDYFGRYFTGTTVFTIRKTAPFANGFYWDETPEFYKIKLYYPEAEMLEVICCITAISETGECGPVAKPKAETAFIDLAISPPILSLGKSQWVSFLFFHFAFRLNCRLINRVENVANIVFQMIGIGAHVKVNITFGD